MTLDEIREAQSISRYWRRIINNRDYEELDFLAKPLRDILTLTLEIDEAFGTTTWLDLVSSTAVDRDEPELEFRETCGDRVRTWEQAQDLEYKPARVFRGLNPLPRGHAIEWTPIER